MLMMGTWRRATVKWRVATQDWMREDNEEEEGQKGLTSTNRGCKVVKYGISSLDGTKARWPTSYIYAQDG